MSAGGVNIKGRRFRLDHKPSPGAHLCNSRRKLQLSRPPQKFPPRDRSGFRPDRRRPAARGPRERRPGEDHVILYGWHPAVEALRNTGRHIRRLLATENSANRLVEELGELRVTPEIVSPREISVLLEPDAVHQGIYIEADPLDAPGLAELYHESLILVLDQITDPHNVGAIVRTAAAFGVDAIVTTNRHTPAATGVLAKSASGGLEHVPFIVVRNLADALIELGKRGFLRIGLDSEGDTEFDSIAPTRPVALVLGAEGKGLRQRTRECCDVVARLEMAGAIKSLNVSNAAAVTLYALTRKLGGAEPN
jgi:23S rRNA (guanosine2251-2'-O)-methyltransferase